MKHFVPVPPSVAKALVKDGAKRFIGALGSHGFRRVLHRRDDGSQCLKFGASWLRSAGLSDGDMVEVELGVDPNPDAVDLPLELAAVLAEDEEAAAAWSRLTAGKQRTLAYGIDRAKRPETRRRRALATAAEAVRMVAEAESR